MRNLTLAAFFTSFLFLFQPGAAQPPEGNNCVKQKAVFGGLTTGQVSYNKIFSYKSSGPAIDFKTDGIIPQANIQAKKKHKPSIT